MPTRVCELCHREFEDTDASVCPDDGGKLYSVAASDDLIGRTIDERFAIKSLIGAGGMGNVYRAFQRSMGRDVALKILPRGLAADARAVKRFLREGQAVSRLSHPNIVTVFDFGQTSDGILYLAMELLEGATLRSCIREQGPLPLETTRVIFAQLLDGLAEAHAAGVIHRDLKPSNVMLLRKVGHRALVKILDFGLAKIWDTNEQSLSRSDEMIGTPRYMSPEQATGGDVDQRTDVYLAGLILYEMLGGKPPFAGETSVELAMHHAKSEPPPIFAGLDPNDERWQLESLAQWCLAKHPSQRPQTVRALREVFLSETSGDSDPSIDAESRDETPTRALRRPAKLLGSQTDSLPELDAESASADTIAKRSESSQGLAAPPESSQTLTAAPQRAERPSNASSATESRPSNASPGIESRPATASPGIESRPSTGGSSHSMAPLAPAQWSQARVALLVLVLGGVVALILYFTLSHSGSEAPPERAPEPSAASRGVDSSGDPRAPLTTGTTNERADVRTPSTGPTLAPSQRADTHQPGGPTHGEVVRSTVRARDARTPPSSGLRSALIRIESTPSGATVWLGKSELGVTPLAWQPRGDVRAPLVLRLTKKGYRGRALRLQDLVSQSRSLSLRPLTRAERDGIFKTK